MIGYRRGMLQEGRFGWCGRSGMGLSNGYFWVRRQGGYNFYLSRQGSAAVDFDHPVAACGPAAVEVKIGEVFEAVREYWLAVKTVSRFGLESAGDGRLRVRTDGEGNGREVPDPVRNLRAGSGIGGRVRLEWDCEPRLGSVRPVAFKIYLLGNQETEGSAELLYAVPWRKEQKHYVWDGMVFWQSRQYRLMVRAETAEGVEDGNWRYVIGRGDCEAPETVEEVRLEMA